MKHTRWIELPGRPTATLLAPPVLERVLTLGLHNAPSKGPDRDALLVGLASSCLIVTSLDSGRTLRIHKVNPFHYALN